MRSDQARNISIIDYLSREGFSPTHTRQNGREVWYRSPLRPDDDTPSFKVDTLINKWFDHGRGEGGNTLDLVIKLKACTVREALALLDQSGLYSGGYAPWRGMSSARRVALAPTGPAGEKENEGSAFRLVEAKPITHPALIQYLALRRISLPIARRYLKEITFKPSNGQLRQFFALGWWNGASWEARSSIFKDVVGEGKDISLLHLKNDTICSVFEGYMDFLSFLSHNDTDGHDRSCIILNSLALRSRLDTIFSEYQFREVHLYLDHDESGRLATEAIHALDPTRMIDKSGLYRGHKDYNAWWMSKKDMPYAHD